MKTKDQWLAHYQRLTQQRARTMGEAITRARNAAQMSQAELAELTGIARPNIARAEAGTHYPSDSTLAALSAALNTQLP